MHDCVKHVDKISKIILPGPIPNTVREPAAICVRPASQMLCAVKLRLNAIA